MKMRTSFLKGQGQLSLTIVVKLYITSSYCHVCIILVISSFYRKGCLRLSVCQNQCWSIGGSVQADWLWARSSDCYRQTRYNRFYAWKLSKNKSRSAYLPHECDPEPDLAPGHPLQRGGGGRPEVPAGGEAGQRGPGAGAGQQAAGGLPGRQLLRGARAGREDEAGHLHQVATAKLDPFNKEMVLVDAVS